jgi:D-alanyl-D-alanine dipeptidase
LKKYETFKETPISITVKTWDWAESRKIEIKECNDKLVPLGLAPDKIVVSPQYFIQKIDGALAESYTRETIYHKLIEASKYLPCGYRFVIFDTWRPLKVQQSLFDILKDELRKKYPSDSDEEITNKTLVYVALPSWDAKKPSPHNTGGAVDLTIADEDGLLLKMGTEFDDPSIKTKTIYYEEKLAKGAELNPEEIEVLKNRRLLYHIMTGVGFTNYVDEWWHYDFGNQNWAFMSKSDHAVYGKFAPSFPWNKTIE